MTTKATLFNKGKYIVPDELRKPFSSELRLIKWSFASTTIWMLITHLYRWMHFTSASHDSLLLDQAMDTNWELSLGRFLQPIYVYIRGNIPSSFLIGVLSILFLSLTVVLICKLLNLVKPLSIVLVSGILSTNLSIVLHNATYLFSLDLSMFTLLLGALSVFLCSRYRYGFILGIPCVIANFALSASIAFPITLMLLYLIACSLRNCPTNYIIKTGCKFLLLLCIGTLLYLWIYPSIQDYFQIAASSYRGFSSLTDFSGSSFLSLLGEAYALPLDYFLHPKTHGAVIVAIANSVLAILLVIGFCCYCIKAKVQKNKILFSLIFIALLPLGMNCVYLFVKGNFHELMTFPFNLYYLLCLIVLYLNFPKKNCLSSSSNQALVQRIKTWSFGITIACFIIILLSNIVFANQVYVKKDLEAQATLSVMTRIVDDVEELDGYNPGETPVAIVGSLRFNEYYSQFTSGYDHLEGVGLKFGSHSVTRLSTYRWYLTYVLNMPMNLASNEVVTQVASENYVQEMPSFPHAGYCQMVDGTAVVKLSDNPDLK